MEFIEIQRRLVTTLLKIPAMQQPQGRTTLLDGLPDPGLVRDYNIARVDLNSMISGLQQMGRLSESGVRPVIVVVDNALHYVPEGSDIAKDLQSIRRDLESYYGGEAQPQPAPVPAEVYEALIFGPQRDTRLPFSFVNMAKAVARSVARLTVARVVDGSPDGGAMYGTGWIIAPGLLITNHHVIDARDRRPPPWGPGEAPAKPADFRAQAAGVVARFDYHVEREDAGHLDCQGATLLAADAALDYAVIELVQAGKVADRPSLPLVKVQPALLRGSRMNIVQHPQGGALRYAIRNNFFVSPGKSQPFLWYQTDTEPGASGSPVCNDDWQVVALHHASTPVNPQLVPQEVLSGQPQQVTVLNEAIRIHDILAHMPADLRQRIEAAQGS